MVVIFVHEPPRNFFVKVSTDIRTMMVGKIGRIAKEPRDKGLCVYTYVGYVRPDQEVKVKGQMVI